MRTQSYELQGKDVPEALRGKTVTIDIGENYRECEGHTEKGETDVCAKFEDGRVISLQGLLRNRSAKALKDANGDAGAALTALQSFATGYKYTIRVEGEGGTSAPKTAKGKQQKAAASVGNKLFEKCAADENLLNRMVKQEIVDRAEFDAWKQARDEAAATATTPQA